MSVTQSQVMDALRGVQDPELGQDLVSLGMIKNVTVNGPAVEVTVELTTPACPLRTMIQQDVEAAVRNIEGVTDVTVNITAQVRSHTPATHLPGVRNIIAVGAGKGGVGKSTLAVNIAVGLAREGATVGLLDADVYGPSIATMMGIEECDVMVVGEKVMPFEVMGVKTISMGNFIPPGQALIWRGPMIHSAIMNLLTQVEWGELDYLIIDLPPGTGDVPLSLAQSLPITGAVVVSTPQAVAVNDAVRAARMYQQLGIYVLGIVENMSYFLCDGCQKEHDLFGRGGAKAAAEELDVPFLGEMPLYASMRASTDSGRASDNFAAGAPSAAAIGQIVRNLAGQVSIRHTVAPAPQPLQVNAGPAHQHGSDCGHDHSGSDCGHGQ